MAALTTVSGYVSLLDEAEDNQVKAYALEQLNALVDQFWAEIADIETIKKIEVLYEDKNFTHRKLAALVASKVFYHLSSFPDARDFALRAEELFDISQKNEYVETMIAKCIDEYIQLRVANYERRNKDDVQAIDARLESIVERMFQRCFEDKEYKQAIGISLEARRLDTIERAVKEGGNSKELLTYTMKMAMELLTSRDFRQVVLRTLVKLYNDLSIPDYISICRCLVFLDDAAAVAAILSKLIKSDNADDVLLCCQIAFELCDNATQSFLAIVKSALPVPANAEASGDKMEVEVDAKEKSLQTLHKILTQEPTIELQLEFLYRNNHTDLNILKNIKNAFEPRNSILHTATIFANALMHSGTTRDTFLSSNIDWLSRAVNWSKFSAAAGLGVIHKGHFKESMNVLSQYLPRPGSESQYTEGGSLFALGLINTNLGHKCTPYLLQQLRTNSANETIVHGACLGLGLSAMATQDQEIFEELMNVLYQDSAVAGEAAGIAMGLVMLGSASANCAEMINFAHDTQHEKIIRGLAIGLALIMYGREEEADTLIDQLMSDKDPILRYGGVFTIGLAYCGTANNVAIRRCLHVAVSDVSDDVRRGAVLALGFVMYRQPHQVPVLVQLLSESYNPHVRYGATLAVGIACSGTAMKEAIDLLEPMARSDPVDFVRQGALIALGMVNIQATEAYQPKVTEIRQLFQERYKDKHEAVMSRFGAIIAQGIIDAGGRNVTIALSSRSGHRNMYGIVGLALFLQYWYWYPYIYFLSLSFTPTAMIGLNKDLKMPKFKFKSSVPPSLFAYPMDVKPPEVEAPSKVPVAQLSTTRKQKARQQKKKKEEGQAMDVDKELEDDKKKEPEAMETETHDLSASTSVPADKKKEEPNFEILENPARVLRAQLRHISFDVDPRYVPATTVDVSGIVLLRDTKPGEQEDLINDSVTASTTTAAAAEENEPNPPEPFEFDG
jgi:26S proteasome regulatory subunit N2